MDQSRQLLAGSQWIENMARELTDETLYQIDDMLGDIADGRDVSPDSVTRAIRELLSEVRRLRDDQQREQPIHDERLLVDQPIANPNQQRAGAVGLDDSTHPTRPPF